VPDLRGGTASAQDAVGSMAAGAAAGSVVPGIGTLLGAGAGLVGNVIGGLFGASAQDEANKTNVALQEDNQAWMAEMSNTAHQREVQDLLKAGLNPILAAKGGASSPSSPPARVDPVNPMSGVGPSIAQAIATARDIETWKSDIRQKNAQAVATAAQAHASLAQAQNLGASAAAIEANMPWIKGRASTAMAEAQARAAKADYDYSYAKTNKGFIDYDAYAKRVVQALDGASSAADIASMFTPKGALGKILRGAGRRPGAPGGSYGTTRDGQAYDLNNGEILNSSGDPQ